MRRRYASRRREKAGVAEAVRPTSERRFVDNRTPHEKRLDHLAILCVIAQPVALLLFWGVSYFTRPHVGALAGVGLAGAAFLSFVAITLVGKSYVIAVQYAGLIMMMGSVTAGLGLGLVNWAFGLVAGLGMFILGLVFAARA